MKNHLINQILLVGLIALTVCTAQAAQEDELIAVLKSQASVVDKCNACKQLRIYGTAESIPALAPLLTDERIGHAARYALEAMPYPQAGAALRNALAKASGKTKVGIIDSLGWRRDTDSVTLLAPLLKNADTTVATTAAKALGRIGNGKAASALIKACNNSNPEIKQAVLAAILNCAEISMSAGNDSQAASLYRSLSKPDTPSAIRVAAWRGLALTDGNRRPNLVIEALTGSDQQLRLVATKLIRETKDEQLVRACLQQWKSLNADAQVLLVNVLAARNNKAALPNIQKAYTSPHKPVRIAAIKALATLGNASSVAPLAKRAANTRGDEQTRARESLKTLRGKDINPEMLRQLMRTDTSVRVELIAALAARGATEATKSVIVFGKNEDKPTRAACYNALRLIAGAEALPEMVKLLENADRKERAQLEKAITTVALREKAQTHVTRAIKSALGDSTPTALKNSIIRILGALGDPSATGLIRIALADNETETRYTAIQALSAWPTAEPKDDLLKIAKTSDNKTHKVLALRGYIDLITRDTCSPNKKLTMYKTAMTLAKSPAEKKKVLSGVSMLRTIAAIEMAQRCLKDPAIKNEAAYTATTIAQVIYPRHPQATKTYLQAVINSKPNESVTAQAKNIVEEINTIRNYIMDWEVSGPYVQDGKGCAELFNIPFAPENKPADAKWRKMPLYENPPRVGYIDLLTALDGGHNRVAYLRTTIDSAEETKVTFEIFSDDGVKAWLNGKLFHENNIARPIPTEHDNAQATFKKGENHLMLKITQNTMPWGVIVRTKTTKKEIVKVSDNFKVHIINAESKFEAAGVFDVNNDGKDDIFSGGFWYEAPTWKKHFVREVKYDGNYYYDFASLPMDIDGDGWIDIASAAWHNKMVFWVRNPGKQGGEWPVIEIDTPGNMETALSFDINGDGQPDVLPNIMRDAAWYEFHRDPSAKHKVTWEKHQLPKQAAGHGNGAGDINGDGRCDIVAPRGWVEQPGDQDGEWKWHAEFDLGHCSVPALVHDVDGDNDADIIWGFGHNYGLFWLEQKTENGKRTWTKHEIDSTWSQPHFMLLADIDNDGTDDLLTGKRYHAHNGNDPGGNDPKCVYYYTFDRTTKKWTRHLIHEGGSVALGINTQAVDIDKDGDIDIVAPGKSGLYLLENLIK